MFVCSMYQSNLSFCFVRYLLPTKLTWISIVCDECYLFISLSKCGTAGKRAPSSSRAEIEAEECCKVQGFILATKMRTVIPLNMIYIEIRIPIIVQL